MDLEILNAINEIKDFQKDLYEKLKHVRVSLDPINNADVYEAVTTLYGADFVKANGSYITFDMFLQCMEIIKIAGDDKGKQLMGTYILWIYLEEAILQV